MPSLTHDPRYPELKHRIVESTGLVYYSDKDSELSERVHKRLSVLGLRDCAAYLSLLSDSAKGERELDALIIELTIGETYFFRHREQFDALRDTVIPSLIRKKAQTKQLRIWSAGCSIGAEPYSIAIMLRQDFSAELADWDVSILGTDINRDFLTLAEAGKFDEWAFRTTDPSLRINFFSPSGKSWVINPGIRKGVVFQYHNLLRHPFPSLINNLAALDLIVCRNVMIYFNRETSRKTLVHFEESLAEGGWLLLGHAEQLSAPSPRLTPVQSIDTLLYQKRPSGPSDTATPFSYDVVPSKEAHVFQEKEAPAPSSASVTIENIRALADRGDFAGAIGICEHLSLRNRLDSTGHFYYALVLEQIGRHEEAEQVLKRVIQLDRNFVLGHYYLGLLCQRQKEPEKARRSFQIAADLLSALSDEHSFAEADGITVRELRNLVQTYLGDRS